MPHVTPACRKHTTAVRPIRVVMAAPGLNLAPRVEQIGEPAHLQALFAQPAVETFQMRVLHQFAVDIIVPEEITKIPILFDRQALHCALTCLLTGSIARVGVTPRT